MPYIVYMSVARRIAPEFSLDGGENAFEYDDPDTPPITNKFVLEALKMRDRKKPKNDDEDASESSSDYQSVEEEGDHRFESFFLCTQNFDLSNISPVRVFVLRQFGRPSGLNESDVGNLEPQFISSKFLQSVSQKLCYLYYNIPGVCYQPAPILVSCCCFSIMLSHITNFLFSSTLKNSLSLLVLT